MKRVSMVFTSIVVTAFLLAAVIGSPYPSASGDNFWCFPVNEAFAAETTTITVSVPGGAVGGGETFTVSIEVAPGAAMAGMQFDLAFDPDLITAVNVEEGELLSQDGANTYFSSGTINNTAGTINDVAGAITTPGQTVSTEGTFAEITFTAESTEGTSALTLSGVVVGDINGQAIEPLSLVNGEVTINVNGAPVLALIGNKSVDEGESLEFTISSTDPDGDPPIYSASNLPSGAGFDPDTGTFYWTPNFCQAGVYNNVRFVVSDGSLTDYEEITITVNQPYEDWDPNTDGEANVLDMIKVGQFFGGEGTAGWIREDTNEDGAIDVLDMTVIGQNWTG
jgi:hypothetical protein